MKERRLDQKRKDWKCTTETKCIREAERLDGIRGAVGSITPDKGRHAFRHRQAAALGGLADVQCSLQVHGYFDEFR